MVLIKYFKVIKPRILVPSRHSHIQFFFSHTDSHWISCRLVEGLLIVCRLVGVAKNFVPSRFCVHVLNLVIFEFSERQWANIAIALMLTLELPVLS